MFYKGYYVNEGKNFIEIEGATDFNPIHTFECGQCFRWFKESDGSYTGIVGNKVANINLINGVLVLKNIDINEFADVWYDYLDLGRDYSTIKKLLVKDDIMKEAVPAGQGIRILKQELWETLISFIISANNRIPMIMKVVSAISRDYGDELLYEGKRYYTFPSVERIYGSSLEKLEVCKGGFRCKYILETARMVAEGEIDLGRLQSLESDEARALLVLLPGVGDKVADCTLLYSGTKHDVFPTDVWVKRVMEELYFKKEASFKYIQAFAKDYFGELAGFAQQYLFYYARENKIGVK